MHFETLERWQLSRCDNSPTFSGRSGLGASQRDEFHSYDAIIKNSVAMRPIAGSPAAIV